MGVPPQVSPAGPPMSNCGRNSQGRAEMCWLPVASGLTPHGLRHAHKSLMSQLKTSEVLSHDRLGHRIGGIAGIYSHVTPAMRAEFMTALTECWLGALQARVAMSRHSPVSALDALLQTVAQGQESAELLGNRRQDRLPNRSQTGIQAHVIKPRKGPLTCVGVAGFEPAASSSRSKSSGYTLIW